MTDEDHHWDRLLKQWEEQAKWDETLRPSVVTKEDPPIDPNASSMPEWLDYAFVALCLTALFIGVL